MENEIFQEFLNDISSKLLNFFFSKAKEIKLSVTVSNNNIFFFFLHKIKYFYKELNVFKRREEQRI